MADEERGGAPFFDDPLFRQKLKHGKHRVVEPPLPPLEGPVADTHAHVHLLDDPAAALARCAVWGVGLVCVIIDVWEDDPETVGRIDGWLADAQARMEGFAAAARAAYGAAALPQAGSSHAPLPGAGSEGATCGRIAPRLPEVRVALGCHPHNARHYDDALEERLRAQLSGPRLAAVGEIGLDYHYDFSPRAAQREAFVRQIRLAKEFGLPVALHLREAHDEAFAILCEEGFPPAGTLLHCFTLGWDELRPWVESGCHVAFGGALTFKNADEVRRAAACAPQELLLTETDAPYMAPEPLRGKPSSPEQVIFTAARMAQERACAPGPDRAAFLAQLMENARRLL